MLMSSLLGITNAYADAAPAAATSGSGFMSFLPVIIVLFVLMYFMVLRPQSKRAKEQRSLLSAIQKGDEVVTIGGILGKVEKITDDYVVLNIAENISITLRKGAIANALPKGTIKTVAGS